MTCIWIMGIHNKNEILLKGKLNSKMVRRSGRSSISRLQNISHSQKNSRIRPWARYKFYVPV